MNHAVIDAAASALDATLDYHGDLALLDLPRRALLVSRGERHPQPDTAWVAAITAAVRQLVSGGETLVTGVDRVAYDAALWVCAQHGGAAILALASAPARSDEWRAFLPARHLLVWPQQRVKRAAVRHARDLLVAWLVDRAYAIHVRKGGHMAELAALLAQRNCPVEAWPLPPAGLKRAVRHARAGTSAPAIRRIAPQSGAWDYLTHYTREPDGPWPGETRGEYLRWLCSGPPFTPRDAFAGLCHILQEKRIRACGRLMPGRAPMVCFTACPPEQMAALRRWRSGLHRWSFTPYGLAVRKEKLIQLGARRVTYVSRNVLATAAPGTREFMQRERSGDYDWSQEAEWRVAGDADLSDIEPADMLVLVATPEEAQRVEKSASLRARITA